MLVQFSNYRQQKIQAISVNFLLIWNLSVAQHLTWLLPGVLDPWDNLYFASFDELITVSHKVILFCLPFRPRNITLQRTVSFKSLHIYPHLIYKKDEFQQLSQSPIKSFYFVLPFRPRNVTLLRRVSFKSLHIYPHLIYKKTNFSK